MTKKEQDPLPFGFGNFEKGELEEGKGELKSFMNIFGEKNVICRGLRFLSCRLHYIN